MISSKVGALHIQRDNISLAWGEVLLHLLARGTTAISPLCLTIVGFDSTGTVSEIPTVRSGLDELLKTHDVQTDIETVAFTIFPDEYWQLANGDREEFFALYRESFTRIQDWNPRNNKRGSYFQRLVDYEGADKGKNQLDWIIREYLRRRDQRVSQFQATTYDPRRDQTSTALLEFPCLQQLSFVPVHDGTLIMNAFYATQQILRKGYGNYLGLCRLGAFMANQMHLNFSRLNIFVGVAQMDTVGKSDPGLRRLAEEIGALINAADGKSRAA
jgi:hypothetical protein